MLKGSRGISKDFVKKSILEKIWASLPEKLLEKKVMISPPTYALNSAATISTPLVWPIANYVGSNIAISGGFFKMLKGGKPTSSGVNIVPKHITIIPGTTYTSITSGFKFSHSDRYVELRVFPTANGNFDVKINNEYISASPIAATTGGFKYFYIDFGSSYKKDIEIIVDKNITFSGALTSQTGSISYPSETRGPRTIIVGDSFVEGYLSTYNGLSSWSGLMGDYLGWDDVWSSGLGSTGYITKASKATYRERLVHDVVENNPDVVIFTGGINDIYSFCTYESVYDECMLLFSQAKQLMPNALIVVFSPFFIKGFSTTSYRKYLDNAWTAIKKAANDTNCIYIDILEQPLPQYVTPISGVLSEATLANATTFKSNTMFGVKSSVTIEDDRAEIAAVSGASAPFTYTLSTGVLFDAHASGTDIKTVGNSYLTGSGKVGATTGYGCCDIVVGSDGTHYTDYGHRYLASVCASALITALKTAQS